MANGVVTAASAGFALIASQAERKRVPRHGLPVFWGVEDAVVLGHVGGYEVVDMADEIEKIMKKQHYLISSVGMQVSYSEGH